MLVPRRRGLTAVPAVDPGGLACTAWVESPFQLLGVIEARYRDHLPPGTVVVPRAGIPALTHTVGVATGLGLPPGLAVSDPATNPGRPDGVWVVGDVLSGVVQRALVRHLPEHLVLVDDGRATRSVLEALVRPGAGLVRSHVRGSLRREVLGRSVATRLRTLAGAGRLHVVSALRFPPDLVAAVQRLGVPLGGHDFTWVRSLPVPPPPPSRVVVLGTSLVAAGLVQAPPYLSWVRRLADGEPVTYLPHRREDHRTLGDLSRMPGVAVVEGLLPVELGLRGLGLANRVYTLPSTAASALALVAPLLPVTEYPVPESWWTPSVPTRVRRRLVPRGESAPSAA